MTREQAEARLVALLNQELTSAETQELETALVSFPDLAEELKLWRDIDALTVEEPSPMLQSRLNDMLTAFRAEAGIRAPRPEQSGFSAWIQRLWPAQPAYGVAIAALCLVLGLAMGWTAASTRPGNGDDTLQAVREELRDTRMLTVVAMLQQPAAGERLRGVGFATDLNAPGTVVLEALVRTLRHDPNVNVRLAALDALAAHRNQMAVRVALLSALREEESPLIQAELVRVVSTIDHPDARQTVERLVSDTALDSQVRQAAAASLQMEW